MAEADGSGGRWLRWICISLDFTAEGQLQAHVFASFAAFERRRIADRTREALARRAAKAVLGRP
jgi:DNA invertase Pin-like site-specific DNA recombinase